MSWITKFVEELKNDKWVLPALKQIREICQLFPEVCIVTLCMHRGIFKEYVVIIPGFFFFISP